MFLCGWRSSDVQARAIMGQVFHTIQFLLSGLHIFVNSFTVLPHPLEYSSAEKIINAV